MRNHNGLEDIYFVANKFNILIIDDSKLVVSMLEKNFRIKGFNTFIATCLKQAREHLLKNDFHYILLDINLPDGSGYDFINELDTKKSKIFILTTNTDDKLREVSYKKGIIDFINKDNKFLYKIDDISRTIEQIEKNKAKNILLVDDSELIKAQLTDIFTNRNYNLFKASNIFTTLEYIKYKKIDLMLLDIELKDENGFDFLLKNKELLSKLKIPIILLSSCFSSALLRDALKFGAVDLIAKPFLIEELILKVDLWIDYKRKEEELISSTQLLEQYKETVDKSSIVSKTDINGVITYVNDKFCKISGYSKKELIGQNQNIVRHKDVKDTIYKKMWESIKDKKSWSGELKNKKKDGSVYWVKTIINPILNANGEIIEYIGIRTDITQQEKLKEFFKNQFNLSSRQFNEALKLSKEYEYAIDESNILSRTNLQGKITYVNEKFCKVSGYTKEELIGQDHCILKHEDTSSETISELWNTIQNAQVWNAVLKNKTKMGKNFWVDTSIVPIKDEKNKIVEYLAIRHDLTEVFELNEEIENTQREIIYKMGEIGETRSKETGNHVKRVAEYSKVLAKLYGLSKNDCEVLFTASPMHDIGKVGIPDSVLKKPGKLDDNEWQIMKGHCEIGYNILKNSKREVLKTAAIVSYEHHEKWDGSGYPRGLKGTDIHVFGRITALADVFDALGSNRCYKKAWEDEKIFKLIKDESGKHFEPKLVELFFDNLAWFLEIREKYKDENL